ncbi:unnamed protein product [Lota lota]
MFPERAYVLPAWSSTRRHRDTSVQRWECPSFLRMYQRKDLAKQHEMSGGLDGVFEAAASLVRGVVLTHNPVQLRLETQHFHPQHDGVAIPAQGPTLQRKKRAAAIRETSP